VIHRSDARLSLLTLIDVYRCDEHRMDAILDVVLRRHPSLSPEVFGVAVKHLAETHAVSQFPLPKQISAAIAWASSQVGAPKREPCHRCNGMAMLPASITYVENGQRRDGEGVAPCPDCNSDCKIPISRTSMDARPIPNEPKFLARESELHKQIRMATALTRRHATHALDSADANKIKFHPDIEAILVAKAASTEPEPTTSAEPDSPFRPVKCPEIVPRIGCSDGRPTVLSVTTESGGHMEIIKPADTDEGFPF
jgi:hypothetical protein